MFSIYRSFSALILLTLGLTCAHAAPPLSDSEAKSILNEYFNSVAQTTIRVGDIKLKNGFNPDQSEDPKNRLFRTDYLKRIEKLNSMGMITFREIGDNSFEWRRYLVALTEKAKVLVIKTTPLGDVTIKCSDITVTRIVKNIESSKGGKEYEDTRLVLGVYDNYATPFCRAYLGAPEVNGMKFRATLKADSFKNRFTLVTFDVSPFDKDVWRTVNVEQ